jgi:hypothetical protein
MLMLCDEEIYCIENSFHPISQVLHPQRSRHNFKIKRFLFFVSLYGEMFGCPWVCDDHYLTFRDVTQMAARCGYEVRLMLGGSKSKSTTAEEVTSVFYDVFCDHEHDDAPGVDMGGTDKMAGLDVDLGRWWRRDNGGGEGPGRDQNKKLGNCRVHAGSDFPWSMRLLWRSRRVVE